jgi:hypothetical protein
MYPKEIIFCIGHILKMNEAHWILQDHTGKEMSSDLIFEAGRDYYVMSQEILTPKKEERPQE